MIIQKQNHHKALYLKAKTMIFYLFNYKTRVIPYYLIKGISIFTNLGIRYVSYKFIKTTIVKTNNKILKYLFMTILKSKVFFLKIT